MIAVYIKPTNASVFLLDVLARKIFRCKSGNVFGAHFEEKITFPNSCIKILVCSQKVGFLIICGKNLTDACIGYFF